MSRMMKRASTVEEQLSILTERGMALDEPAARQWLKNVSYYRLSGYWYGYRVLPDDVDPKNPQRLDDFIEGTSFTDVVALYEFDRKLRTLVHDGLERIEVALRARIGELLLSKGELSYRDPLIFRDSFDHTSRLDTAMRRVERAKKRNHAIAHYSTHYDDYPFWVLADVLDFSDLSQLFDGLFIADQRRISESFGCIVDPGKLVSKHKKSYYSQDPLARWCEQLTVVRNTCAHHARLWNRYFTPASTNALKTISLLSSLPKGQSERLYGTLLIMGFLLRSTSPRSTWMHKVIDLIDTAYAPLPMNTIDEMGFPDDWKNNFLNLTI
ncbi:Abi-like protein [Corynebacterium choanae]|uniref:Abi-like protein n=2 Tax=Corynebacterium choanae TaxID=1862358 RepID=A0A3G6J870_9CORY|nr:Abi-like protein [Corynebacterium choanae]